MHATQAFYTGPALPRGSGGPALRCPVSGRRPPSCAARMIFGGHMTEHDFHLVGLNAVFLGNFLEQAGFATIRKVDSFGLFDDTSEYRMKDIRISCNMIAEK